MKAISVKCKIFLNFESIIEETIYKATAKLCDPGVGSYRVLFLYMGNHTGN